MVTRTAGEIVDSVRITDVWRALGGQAPRRGRAVAFWRDRADGLNVSLSDAKGMWKDFARDERGGVLDLIQKVRGGDRYDALRWLADYAGIPLDSDRWSPEQKREYGRRRRAAEREAVQVAEWRDGLVNAAREFRNSSFRAYHRARRHLLRCGTWERCCQVAADVADACEPRYMELDASIDELLKASSTQLVEAYRATQRVAA
jgi:hypothetical protein